MTVLTLITNGFNHLMDIDIFMINSLPSKDWYDYLPFSGI